VKVKIARAAAVKWVLEQASRETWFEGAYFSGSTVDLPENAELPESSDIDVVL
jgi:hypothetical protein